MYQYISIVSELRSACSTLLKVFRSLYLTHRILGLWHKCHFLRIKRYVFLSEIYIYKVKSLCNRNNLLKLHAHYARMQSNALRLHARSARMQSVALQSSATPCVLRGYRREETRSLRSRAFGLADIQLRAYAWGYLSGAIKYQLRL